MVNDTKKEQPNAEWCMVLSNDVPHYSVGLYGLLYKQRNWWFYYDGNVAWILLDNKRTISFTDGTVRLTPIHYQNARAKLNKVKYLAIKAYVKEKLNAE